MSDRTGTEIWDIGRALNLGSREEIEALETIYKNEWVVRSVPNPPVGGVKSQAAVAALQAATTTGKKIVYKEIAQKLDVSVSTVTEAARDIKAGASTSYTKAQDHQVEARIRMLDKAREAEFNERVRLAMLEKNKAFRTVLEQSKREANEKSERYERILNNYKPIFTEEEYRNILICLHPDNSASKERREAAFRAFSVMKLQLTGKK